MYPRYLLHANSSTDATSHATASMTPVSGRVYTVACINIIGAGTASLPTPTGTNGFNGTYTQIDTVTQDQIRVTLWKVTAVSSVAGAITFDYSGVTHAAAAWLIDEWQEQGATFNVQSNTQAVNGAASMTFALSAFASTLNGVYVVGGAGGSFLAIRGVNAQGVMMQIPITATAGTEVAACSFFSPGNITAPQISSTGTPDFVGIAIEVENGLSGGSGGATTLLGGALVR